MTKAKQEVLFLAHRIPYPPNKGDKIRSWRLLKHLAERYDVHLAAFVDDPRDFDHQDFLKTICASVTLIPLAPKWATMRSALGFVHGAPLSVAYFHDRRMARVVEKIRARPLAAEIVFSSAMAQYVEKPLPGRQRIVDFCDADSEKWRQYAQDASPLMKHVYAREARLLARAETKIANWADASFAITPAEANLFNQRADLGRHVGWWANGVDTDYFNPEAGFEPLDAPADIVFTGMMDYRANVDAVLHFHENIWPIIRKAKPTARFAIVGANPAPQILALDGQGGVSVTGRVEDVRPWIAEAKLVVAPMRIARGVQNKVLEAMAMAKPVVATTAATTGIGGLSKETITIVDGVQGTATEILSLLEERRRAETMGDAARALVLHSYQWNEQLKRFDAALAGEDEGVSYASSKSSSPSMAFA